MTEEQTARFWSRVDKSEGCWLWVGRLDDAGYGLFDIQLAGDKRKRPHHAQRIAWIVTYGAVHPSLFVCHHCDVKGCVNPDHLFAATHAGNVKDAIVKKRYQRDPSSHHYCTKLSNEQVREIRRLYLGHMMNQPQLAARYGVNSGTISRIVRGEARWRVQSTEAESA